VPLPGGLRQHVLQAGLDPLGAVVRDPRGGGDGVRRLEPDAPDLGGQAVRLGADDVDRGAAVLLVDAHGQRGGHAHALQEDHDLLDRPLLLPRRGDQPGPLRAEAGHLGQPRRLLLDHPQRVGAEVVDDPLGQLGADALDQARAQVAADALHGRGQHGGVVLDHELPAVLRVGAPPAVQAQRLPRLRAEQRAHDGDQGVAPAGVDPGDGVAGLRVGEGDALQRRLEHRPGPPLLHAADGGTPR